MADTIPPYSQIDYLVADRIATITLNRPDQLNAFTQVMRDELIDAFDRADSDDDVRAVVVTGRGRAFCAGADLSAGRDTFSPLMAAITGLSEGTASTPGASMCWARRPMSLRGLARSWRNDCPVSRCG